MVFNCFKFWEFIIIRFVLILLVILYIIFLGFFWCNMVEILLGLMVIFFNKFVRILLFLVYFFVNVFVVIWGGIMCKIVIDVFCIVGKFIMVLSIFWVWLVLEFVYKILLSMIIEFFELV